MSAAIRRIMNKIIIIVRIELARDQIMLSMVERIIPIEIFLEAAKFERRLESSVKTAKPTTGEKSMLPKRKNLILEKMFKNGSQILPRKTAGLL
jgi:hypothetical protein